MKKHAALYDPYLDVLGGGEKHILEICKVLERHGYDLSIFWDEDLSAKIKQQLHIELEDVTFTKNIFKKNVSVIKKRRALAEYDVLFYVTDGSYFFSSAKKTVVFCMVPKRELYHMNLFNRVKTMNQQFVCNSHYTQVKLAQWGVHAQTIYPYLENEWVRMPIDKLTKEPMILVAGRFFKHLHAKRQDVAIAWFKDLQRVPRFRDFRLVLVGGMKDEDAPYVEELKTMIGNTNAIEIHTNVDFVKLKTYYQKALFYWHFAGYEVDERAHPENAEHLGITPLEAMSAGCIPCAYKLGGPTEIIRHNETGILFKQQNELFSAMEELVDNREKQAKMRRKAKEFVKNTFSYEVFEKRVVEVLEL
ncbi:glycosyltransferase family 4 protein [Candidatus Woesebacteria bacterium]|nr:glycosyltransferase family 4 protein [Candidatus Woesebacteria bacterium]